MGLIAQLQQQAAGQGPSLAQLQLQQATGENMNNAMALGAAQQGQGLGAQAALRSILDNQARIQQQSALQSAMLRNQEQMQAREQLGGVLGGVRGQDLGAAQAQAGNELNREQFNANINQANINRRMGLIDRAAQAIPKIATAGATPAAAAMAAGGPVPGRALFPGNDYGNDQVPALLSPGEIVLPRSVAQDPDAPDLAAQFVADVKKLKPKKGGAKASTMKRLAELEERIQALEGVA
jgi:hypothetical protein